MRACFVEVIRPGPDYSAGMSHVAEHGFVQEFVAHIQNLLGRVCRRTGNGRRRDIGSGTLKGSFFGHNDVL
jgi:hypothetical protein